MDKLEASYRDWWSEHTPEQRRLLQSMHGVVNPRQVADIPLDVDGVPISVGMVDNPVHGVIYLPRYLRTWNPDDDNPTTLKDDDDD